MVEMTIVESGIDEDLGGRRCGCSLQNTAQLGSGKVLVSGLACSIIGKAQWTLQDSRRRPCEGESAQVSASVRCSTSGASEGDAI